MAKVRTITGGRRERTRQDATARLLVVSPDEFQRAVEAIRAAAAGVRPRPGRAARRQTRPA